MSASQKTGQFVESNYFDNTGGLNISDSPFKVLDSQATGGANFEYTMAGAVQKRRGPLAINAVADSNLFSHGIDIYNTTLGAKTVIRAADRKIQAVDPDSLTFTNLSQDTTAASTNVFPSSTTTPTVFSQYNTESLSRLNFAGATDGVYSVYSPTKYTKNGSVAPTGTFTASTIAGGGAWLVTGTYKYAVGYTKASTLAESNAYSNPVTVSANVTSDVYAVVAAVTNSVVLTFSALGSVDTVTYNKLNLYRSAVNGADGFTTGDLVASLTLPVTSYTDTGGASLLSINIPRADNVVLDNSILPAGTYGVLTTWKRRLVTATGTLLQFSDIGAPESWPTVNTITIPSGGPITGLAVISFNTEFGNDEYLAVFKERELWLVRGNDYTDVTLSFIDAVGCANQSAITLANGFLSWIDFRGLYLWDGSGKPIYASKALEPFFDIDGDLDKTQLRYAVSTYFRNRNMIYWFLSSKTYGTQKFVIKMDLRLSLPSAGNNLSSRIMDGVFVTDTLGQPVFASKTYLPTASSNEVMLNGDSSGFLYYGYQVYSDSGSGIAFQYDTAFLNMGSPNISKRFNKVILWADAIGNWDVTLDWWSGYRSSLSQKSTLAAPVTTQPQSSLSLWDVAYWDESFWDDYTQSLSPIVFNLNNDQGNSEGDCIKLRFRNSGVDQPVTIYGYTVIWTEKALSK